MTKEKILKLRQESATNKGNALFLDIYASMIYYLNETNKEYVNIYDYINYIDQNGELDSIFYDRLNEMTWIIQSKLKDTNKSIYDLLPTLSKDDPFNIYQHNQRELALYIISESLKNI